jgi:eukaryotic-like serine/threonine-protein kinase
LVMELLKGEPLEERLNREGKLPLPEVLRIGREIAEALSAAHACGLIHRDIKPANIWLEAPTGRVKILDFGLARAVSEDSGLTQQGQIIGTLAYIAPEQGRGEAVDARCDLFSLGVVLYQLCTGQNPFKGKDKISTMMKVASHQPPAPIQLNADIPQRLSNLVKSLLEKEADKRPASAAEVLQALESQTGATRVRATKSRTPLLVAFGLLALVPLVWWLAAVILRDETANGTNRVDGADGPKAELMSLDPDRKAAEYVLSIGGVVRVNGQDRAIKAATDLPPELFRLTWVTLRLKKQLTDAGLANFKDCKNLTHLNLQETQVSDAGLAYFKDCKNLTHLLLGRN